MAGSATLPLVSVVIPVYNSEKYISETLNSVCSQTYKNIEIIIVDDGSTDSSPGIIKDKMTECPNIVYIRKENAGVSAARNRGIRASRGAYIAFQDSDDLWEPIKIELQVAAMLETGMNACYCGQMNLFEETGALVYDKFKNISGDILIPYLRNKVWPLTIGWIINRGLILQNDIFFDENTSSGEDSEFFIKIASITRVCVVPEFLTTYRRRGQSLSGYKIEHRNLVNVWIRIRDWIRDRSGRADADSCARIIDEFRIPSVIIQCLYEERKLGLRGATDHFTIGEVDSSRVKIWGIIRHCYFFGDTVRLVLMKLAATNDHFYRLIRFVGDIIYRR
ncbi:MAG TPA: glycosyltransferase family 2 protein [Spirochaetota bacterium]|nr:glycosyltransferase family 2 protein [Spirochaetota bacterium]HQF09775.1 glycosyltransferase family 2 protein [Spirochaetota bacterium]HQH99620.1 glycosyltransferase family 2 protein [Spirochaetota bacterium]HQJ73163.1 glycosyltransferase family 2 protein [Spirochaetota bacterium]HRS79620.1 glycosyltransferase family 2 protein [Spirochaetota bacterium]